MTVEELKELNKEEHEILARKIDAAGMIKKWQQAIIYVLLVIIGIAVTWSGVSLDQSKRAQEESLKAFRTGMEYQKKALDIQYRYAAQLDSITKQLKHQKTILYPLSDTVGKMFDSIRWFYDNQWKQERNFTRSVYNSEIRPNTIRSKENRKRIEFLEKINGVKQN